MAETIRCNGWKDGVAHGFGYYRWPHADADYEGPWMYFGFMFDIIVAQISEFIGRPLSEVAYCIEHKVTYRPVIDDAGENGDEVL